MICIGSECNFLNSFGLFWRAFYGKFANFPLQVFFTYLKKVSCDYFRFLTYLVCSLGSSSTGCWSTSACVCSKTIWSSVSVSLFYLDICVGYTKFLSKNLGIGCLVTLPLRFCTKSRYSLTGWMDTHFTTVEHFDS